MSSISIGIEASVPVQADKFRPEVVRVIQINYHYNDKLPSDSDYLDAVKIRISDREKRIYERDGHFGLHENNRVVNVSVSEFLALAQTEMKMVVGSGTNNPLLAFLAAEPNVVVEAYVKLHNEVAQTISMANDFAAKHFAKNGIHS